MDRLLKFIGLATVIIGVGYSILHLKSNSDTFNEVLRIFGLVSAIALIGFIVARLIWGKNWIIKGGATMLVGSDLISAFKLFLDELPTPSKATTANLSGHLVYRFTRLGVIGLLLAMIPVVLLWQQNQKIDQQTKLFEKQNEKIDSQIQLEESNRRGALIVMMSNIMDKLDDELTQDWGDDEKRNLSPQLIGRIAALSQSFRPYRFWQDSMLIENPLSPERGQLLTALINSDLDTTTYKDIYNRATFEKSYLENVDLRFAYLKGANLKYANMSKVNFMRANLEKTDLSKSNLKLANLNRAYLLDTNISSANLNKASFWKTYMKRVDFKESNLKEAILRQAEIQSTSFREADLSDADIMYTAFSMVDMVRANLEGAKIGSLNLKEIFIPVFLGVQDWEIDSTLRIGYIQDNSIFNHYCLTAKKGGPAQQGGK